MGQGNRVPARLIALVRGINVGRAKRVPMADLRELVEDLSYSDVRTLLNSGNVELLDIPRLTHQLQNLERRTSRAGKESVDHGPGGYDDLANSAAGALVTAAENRKRKLTWGRDLDAQRNRLPSASYLPHIVHSVVSPKKGEYR